MRKVSSEYVSICRYLSEYDSATFHVNHEVPKSDHVRVEQGVSDRNRTFADTIRYYQWLIVELKTLGMELGVFSEKEIDGF